MSNYIRKVAEKLPPINTEIYIISKKMTFVCAGKMRVYSPLQMTKMNVAGSNLKEGDLFWGFNDPNSKQRAWGRMEDYPYWTDEEGMKQILKQHISPSTSEESVDRFDLLDINNE